MHVTMEWLQGSKRHEPISRRCHRLTMSSATKLVAPLSSLHPVAQAARQCTLRARMRRCVTVPAGTPRTPPQRHEKCVCAFERGLGERNYWNEGQMIVAYYSGT